jgi:hypothetical protein
MALLIKKCFQFFRVSLWIHVKLRVVKSGSFSFFQISPIWGAARGNRQAIKKRKGEDD